MISTFTSYSLITRDIDRALERKASEAANTRETKYFRENIRSIETIDEFLDDSRLYGYAMRAFGLDDMIFAKGYMRKVLEEGVSNADSFANKLLDERFKDFAAAFDFEGYGKVATQRAAATTEIVAKYTRLQLETDAGEENEGVRLALYFDRKAPEIDSYYDILADKALTQFFRTAFALPEAMSGIDIDQQVKLLEKTFDLGALKDPEELRHLTQRFTVMHDMNNAEPDPIMTLFGDRTAQATIDDGLILALHNLKFGG